MVYDALQKDGTVSRLDKDGKTPLWWAALSYREDVVELLLQHPALNFALEKRCGPRKEGVVSVAARTLQPTMLDVLISTLSPNINAKDTNGMTALMYACSECFFPYPIASPFGPLIRKPRFATLQRLLQISTIKPNVTDKEGQTALHKAAEAVEPSALEGLLQNSSIDKNPRDHQGRTPLHYAVMAGTPDGVELLLNCEEIEADAKDEDRMTPLAYASRDSRYNTMRLLASRPTVDLQSEDSIGRTPLHHAAICNDVEAVECLLCYEGIQADVKDQQGMTPLACASRESHYNIVHLLASRTEVDTQSVDNFGRTPCFHALLSDFPDRTMDALPDESQTWNPQDLTGRTPLSWAVEELNLLQVKKLLDCSEVDPSIKDFEGHDPLYWCVETASDLDLAFLDNDKYRDFLRIHNMLSKRMV